MIDTGVETESTQTRNVRVYERFFPISHKEYGIHVSDDQMSIDCIELSSLFVKWLIRNEPDVRLSVHNYQDTKSNPPFVSHPMLRKTLYFDSPKYTTYFLLKHGILMRKYVRGEYYQQYCDHPDCHRMEDLFIFKK